MTQRKLGSSVVNCLPWGGGDSREEKGKRSNKFQTSPPNYNQNKGSKWQQRILDTCLPGSHLPTHSLCMCLFFFNCRGIFGTSWVCRVALACLHGSSLLQLLTGLDHALLWSLKNESRFYCELYQNDFKTKQTTRACSIYSLLLTHLKEHKGSPSLPPSKTNV